MAHNILLWLVSVVYLWVKWLQFTASQSGDHLWSVWKPDQFPYPSKPVPSRISCQRRHCDWSIHASLAGRGRLRSGLRLLTHTGVGVFPPTWQTWKAQGSEWWSQLTWQAVTINCSGLIKILRDEPYLLARGTFYRKRCLVPHVCVKLRSAALCRIPHRSPESALSFCGERTLTLWKNSSGKSLWWQAVICLW